MPIFPLTAKSCGTAEGGCPYVAFLINAYRGWGIFGSAEVARCFVFVYAPHHKFIEHVIPTGVKLDRFRDVAVFFLDSFVIRGYVQRELAFFLVSLFELQGDRRYRLRFCT